MSGGRDPRTYGEKRVRRLGELLLEELVRAAQLASPAELPVILNRYAEAMGLGTAAIYLVDIQQRLLVPFVEGEPDLDLETSLAGWTYRTDSSAWRRLRPAS